MSQLNKKYWETISEEYANIVGETGDINHQKIINPTVFALLGNLDGKTVLDAGCGNGYMSKQMAQTAKQVIGIDFTSNLIQDATRKNNTENIKFIEGDLTNLPFRENTFDVILCHMVLMDIESLESVAQQFNKVIKTTGFIVVSVIHPCFENPPRTYTLFDDKKKRIGRVIQKYFETGLITDERNKVGHEPYLHYHHMICDYVNTFAKHNLYIETTLEPNGFEIDPNIGTNPDAPTFLIMKVVKKV